MEGLLQGSIVNCIKLPALILLRFRRLTGDGGRGQTGLIIFQPHVSSAVDALMEEKDLMRRQLETAEPLVHPHFQWPLNFPSRIMLYNVVYELSFRRSGLGALSVV
ncbi:hypothetical protein TNIN_343021 [Trichonephila inaurata madagascariensis]|uniref:Uncharacterized protein n=1 Tax=Trichonephila inaurata madagascariensis TaxID=2747483 RepID=A0A8X6WZQ1_9ARAC|nr:hypothetical protein TNIN_343021 [Trichonephila inaurata madagascariensis]